MWKKKLILVITLLAGLYYFLEFVVPPIMPGQSTAGIVRSISKKTNEATKTTNATIELATIQRTVKLPISATRMVDRVVEDATQRVPTAELDATNIIKLDGSEQGVVLAKNSAQVKIGVLSGSKTVTANVVAGKSRILAFKVEATGGESQIEDVSTLAEGDVLTQIGPTTYLSSVITDANNSLNVLATMPWGFALFSLWFMHSSAIRKRTKEWYMSVLFFVGLAFGIFAGLGYGLDPKQPIKLAFWTIQNPKFLIDLNDLVAQRIQFAFYSATFSILSFYLASAAYRSFKAKSREAVLMMVSALIVMLGQIPFGVYLTSWIPGQEGLVPAISQWLQLVLNTAAYRGMLFGIVLASMAIGLRYWLSLERGAFFDREL